MKQNIVEKFWKDYYKADYFGRDKLIESIYKYGYNQALDDFNILHGKDTDKFLKEMKDREKGKISPKQRKFLKECQLPTHE